ncbi:MAG: sodium/solute symporter [Planctomycetaceae bacterium]|nr:sodium/solute symporter [Planctomycetaceae bacterium]
MHPLDIAVIVIYMITIIGLGIWFGQHQSRKEFFLANSSMGWLTVGLSVMATLFSSNSFVFYPSAALGNSLRIGLSLVAFALMTPVVMFVFIPVYSKLKVETAYEYLERRFHVSVRAVAAGLFVLLRIGWMASATYAASVVVSSVSGFDQITVIIGLGVVAIGYTMLGGLRAVMWTDVVQFFVFALTIILALILIMAHTHMGLGEVFTRYFDGRDGLVIDFDLSMTREYGTWAILIGVFLEAVSAFGVDQVAVQRYLSARSMKTSQIGAFLNLVGIFVVIPALLMVGVALYAHYMQTPGELGVGTLTEVLKENPKLADEGFPTFVRLHFPPGMAGLFLAALMAAIMSSIDSGIHSVTTVLVVDFRDRLLPFLRPEEGKQELNAIRITVLIIGAISIGLACMVGGMGNVFDIGKKLTSAFGGPLLGVFVLALFSKRTNTLGALLSAILSTVITLYLMYTQTWFSVWYWPIGFGLSILLGLVLSYLASAPQNPMTFRKIMQMQESET